MGDATPTHVIDHVFLGSKVHARDRDQLQKLKITHILNVTPTKKLDPLAGVPNFFEKDKVFEYRRCAMFDNKAEDISGALEGCVAFIERAKFYGRVLVHCSKGVSRSVSMVIAYLIKIHGMPYTDALRLVQSKRSIAQPNASFERQLIAYADRMERLRKRKAADSEKQTTTPASSNLSSSCSAKAGANGRPPAKSIGPQLPPHLRKQQPASEDHEAVNTPRQNQDLEKEKETSTATIGPALPPGASNKRKISHDGSDDESKNQHKKLLRVAIGPARPPSTLDA